MAFPRFIERHRRFYGPYAYTSIRVGDKVHSVYLGAVSSNVFDTNPEFEIHRKGDHIMRSVEEVQEKRDFVKVTLQTIDIDGGGKEYKKIVQGAYKQSQLTPLGIEKVRIVTDMIVGRPYWIMCFRVGKRNISRNMA